MSIDFLNTLRAMTPAELATLCEAIAQNKHSVTSRESDEQGQMEVTITVDRPGQTAFACTQHERKSRVSKKTGRCWRAEKRALDSFNMWVAQCLWWAGAAACDKVTQTSPTTFEAWFSDVEKHNEVGSWVTSTSPSAVQNSWAIINKHKGSQLRRLTVTFEHLSDAMLFKLTFG